MIGEVAVVLVFVLKLGNERECWKWTHKIKFGNAAQGHLGWSRDS